MVGSFKKYEKTVTRFTNDIFLYTDAVIFLCYLTGANDVKEARNDVQKFKICSQHSFAH